MIRKKNNKTLEFTVNDLPEGWVKVPLNKISEINPKKPNSNTIEDSLEVSFVPMKCVEELTGGVDLSMTQNYANVRKGYTYFKNGDIIFAKITPCMENGKVAIMHELKNGIGFGSTEFHVIRLNDELDRNLYFYYLIQDSFRNPEQINMKGTAGQLRVPQDYLEESIIPIPPINEQKRIVAKIESIFSQIDAMQKRLEMLSSQIKSVSGSLSVLKNSILKQAFEGKLMPQDPNDEPAGILLKKINSDPDRIIFEKKNIPKGWVKTKLNNICELIGGGTPSRQKPEYFNGDIIWLTPTEIPKHKIIRINNSREKITELGLKKSSAKIIPINSVLLTSRASIGYVAIAGTEVTTNQGFASFVCNKTTSPYFLAYWLFGNKNLLESKSSETTFKEISKSKLRELEFKLPPLPEQHRIVSKIESIFVKIDAKQKEMEKLEMRLNSITDTVNELKQSILKLAFEGKLVSQDPTDEPAQVLLEKIKSQKSQNT